MEESLVSLTTKSVYSKELLFLVNFDHVLSRKNEIDGQSLVSSLHSDRFEGNEFLYYKVPGLGDDSFKMVNKSKHIRSPKAANNSFFLYEILFISETHSKVSVLIMS